MWWHNGNTLALVEAMTKFARNEDAEVNLNSNLIGAARQMGMSEDDIRNAFDSDRGLVIYEP